jgi:2-iminobutanoate/2-iminopropanoate deaminase
MGFHAPQEAARILAESIDDTRQGQLSLREPRARRGGAGMPTDPEYLMVAGAPPPPPTAAYSHAVRAGAFLFVTGQLGVDPATNRLVAGGIEAQTHQVMRNLTTVLADGGASLDRTVMARVYLANFADYAAMNAVYATYCAAGRHPARTTVGVTGLALEALVEIDLIVRLGVD